MATVSDWQVPVRAVAEQVMQQRAVPGMVIAAARGDDPPKHLVLGVDHRGCPLAEDSLLPVASITKLATALTVLRLVDRGVLALDDPLGRHLPEAAAAREGVTVRTLLCHVAGLPEDVPGELAPYDLNLDWPRLAHGCLGTPLEAPPRTRLTYSNVGPGLLAVVVERLTGRPFNAVVADLVLEPLGIEGYLGQEPPRYVSWIAGDLGEHTGTALDPYNSPFWRSLALPWGGLVTTAAGALALVRAFAGQPAGFISPALLTEATQDQTGGLPGRMVVIEWPRCPWGLGVDLRGDKMPHFAPVEAAPTSFGHAGASGCLAWADPTVGVAWAMLGARFFADWWEDWPAIGAAVLAAS